MTATAGGPYNGNGQKPRYMGDRQPLEKRHWNSCAKMIASMTHLPERPSFSPMHSAAAMMT